MSCSVLLLALLMTVSPDLWARSKNPNAGSIKDSVYTDQVYDFSFRLPDGWSVEMGKKNDPVRLRLIADNPAGGGVLESTGASGEGSRGRYLMTTVSAIKPIADFWVIKTQLSHDALIDSITSHAFSSEDKDRLIRSLEPPMDNIHFDTIVTAASESDVIADRPVKLWRGVFAFEGYGHFSGDLQQGAGLLAVPLKDERVLLMCMRASPGWVDYLLMMMTPSLRSLTVEE